MCAKARESAMITIDYLKHHPQHIPTVATLWLDTIGKMWAPHVTREEVIQRFQTRLNSDILPLTLVALDNNIPVGMCSLCFIDGIRSDLSPWLGSLLVDPKYQNKGIGKNVN
jgi:predicted N-acetyltransferase YhbS